jgi:hypothetical protein
MKKSHLNSSSFVLHPSSVFLQGGVLFFLAVWLLLGCGENSTSRDDLPPSRPRWVERSADNGYPQQGIRPEPTESDAHYWVRVEWYANPEPDVVEYRISRFREFEPIFTRYSVADLVVGENPETPYGAIRYSWVDRGDSAFGTPANVLAPDPDTRETRGYFWLIDALDSAGNRSATSDSAYYRLLDNPLNLTVARSSPNVYTASWQYVANPNEILSYYMLRVYPARFGPDSVVWYQLLHRYDAQNSVDMDFSQAVSPPATGSTYVCQLNVIANRASPVHADSLVGAAVSCTFVYQD